MIVLHFTAYCLFLNVYNLSNAAQGHLNAQPNDKRTLTKTESAVKVPFSDGLDHTLKHVERIILRLQHTVCL
jgi:hypothetical protein